MIIKVSKLILLFYLFPFIVSCLIQKGEDRAKNKFEHYVDSFEVRSPLFVLNESLLSSKLDSLIDKAKIVQSEDFWDKKFPPYITIEPYLEQDTVFLKLKISKDYLLNFDPPEMEFSKKYLYGFGVSKYKNLLVRLNGSQGDYILKTKDGPNELVINTNDKLNFYAYGLRNKKDSSWLEPFFPFVRRYYIYKNGFFEHFLTEVEK